MAHKRSQQRIDYTGSYKGNKATIATHALISDPGDGLAIQITEITIQAVEDGPVLCTLETSGGGEVRDFRLVADGDGFSQLYPPDEPHPWPASEGVSLTLDAAKEVAIFIRYDIVDSRDVVGTVDVV